MKYKHRPSSGTRGAISELRVAANLMEARYLVARNLSPNGMADLIAWKDGELLLIDVKTAVLPSTANHIDPRVSLITPDSGITFDRKINLLGRQQQCEPRLSDTTLLSANIAISASMI